MQSNLEDLEAAVENSPTGPKHKPPKYTSETDPQSAWSLKDEPGRFGCEVNYLADNKHAIIVGVAPTPVRLSQEIVAATDILDRQVCGYAPTSIASDKSYNAGPFLSWLLERKNTPDTPVLDRRRQTDGKLTRDALVYDHTIKPWWQTEFGRYDQRMITGLPILAAGM